MASSSNSPCAACKFLRRKCTPECVFAPYFPPDQPLKFANAHRIFGASNISKILNDIPPHQREDAVNSLAYEAEARIRDPVYGCVGAISFLKRHVAALEHELMMARSELSRYMVAGLIRGPSIHQQTGALSSSESAIGIMQDPQSVSEQILSTRELMFTRDHQMLGRDQQQLDLQVDNQVAREAQILDQVRRAGGSPYEAELIAMGMINVPATFRQRSGGDGRSTSSGEGTSMSTLSSP